MKQKGKNNSFISGIKDKSQLTYQLMFLPVKLIQFTRHLQQEVSLWPYNDSSFDDKICRRRKTKRYLMRDALNTKVFGTAQSLLASGQFSLYQIFHDNKFYPNNWHKKNSTRYKRLRDWAFHASLEEAAIACARLF